MAIVKIIEVIGSSEKSFDDAARNAVSEASRTVKNIKSINIQNFNAKVSGDKITTYGVNAKISFEVNP